MAEYTVSIAGVRGAYNKVKSALTGLDHSYDKGTKTFTFTADEAPAMPAGLTAVSADADPKPEPVTPDPSPAAVPAPASAPSKPAKWAVEVDVPRFGGSVKVEVGGPQPDPARFTRKFGGVSCTVKNAKGKVVASWP